MRGHYLKGNASTRVPSNHIVLDTEATITPVPGTNHERQTLRLGCAIGWRRDHGRTTRRSVCHFPYATNLHQWLRQRLSTHRTTWVWAHNAAYDLSLIDFWGLWQSGAYVPEWHCLEDPPTILSGHLWGCRVMVVDSMNWLPHSLATIGEWVRLSKGTMPAQSDDPIQLDDYCYRDVEILEKAVGAICDLVESHDLGVMRPTSAGQAMQCYRHRWRWPNLCIPDDVDHKVWERNSYYGGRCELFYRGAVRPWSLQSSSSDPSILRENDRAIAGPVTTLDVTGLYTSVLRDQLLPSRVLDRATAPLVSDLRRSAERYGVVAEVVIQSDDHPYPVRHAGKVLYAIGRYTTTLAGPELVYALRHNHVRLVVRAATYQLDPIAREYAEYWSRLREDYKSDPIMRQLCKSIPNSWAGKWGQQTDQWEPFPDVQHPPDRPWYRWPGSKIGERGIEQYQALAGKVSRRCKRIPSLKSFPAIAAYVTSLGRARMDDLRASAGTRQVLYQCTDSLHVLPGGLVGLERHGEIHDATLGYLRQENVYKSVDYIGINLMRVDGSWHAAGLGRLHTELPDGNCDVTTFERLGSLLCRQPDGSVTVSRRPWKPEYKYDHSIVGEDGWCTPHRLP